MRVYKFLSTEYALWDIANRQAKNLRMESKCTVVTQESLRKTKSKIKIPTICKALDVPYINTYEMLDNLKFRHQVAKHCHGKEDHKLKAYPAHPAPIQGSDGGRAQGETTGENKKEKSER
jgi:hypothetical protein